MLIVYFCGATFKPEADVDRCPQCGELHCVAGITYRDIAEMEADLVEILMEHEPNVDWTTDER